NGDYLLDLILVRRLASDSLSWMIDIAPFDGQVDVGGLFGSWPDRPLTGDFNGDGITDLALFRGDGRWTIRLSNANAFSFDDPVAISNIVFGEREDEPLTGDFDGDGYDDIAVYRERERMIYVNLHDVRKPLCQGFCNLDERGSADREIPLYVVPDQPATILVADFDRSRIPTAPLPSREELGDAVNLRHGWSCIFDSSLDLDKWVE